MSHNVRSQQKPTSVNTTNGGVLPRNMLNHQSDNTIRKLHLGKTTNNLHHCQPAAQNQRGVTMKDEMKIREARCSRESAGESVGYLGMLKV